MSKVIPRDADATRQRLIAAAAAEFARYGIAGARVDRIAADAKSNKAQIYHYFSSKDGLFDAVFAALVAQVVAQAPMDAENLPEYAGTLFDGYVQHPQIARLATWHRLERGGQHAVIAAVADSNAAKVAAIAKAQDRGVVTSFYPPEVILGLVTHTAALWTAQTPEYDQLTAHLTQDLRREVVVSAVRALTASQQT